MAIDVILVKHPGAIYMGDAADAVLALDQPGRFDLVVFCAKEFPPPPQALRDRSRMTRAYFVPLDDSLTPITQDEAFAANQAAIVTAKSLLKGKRVIVTCMKGKNRSGLVTALALHILSGSGGAAALKHVRARRIHVEGQALTNPSFAELLTNLHPVKSRERPLERMR